MKFKSIIILFNVLIFLFLGALFIFPLVILGRDMVPYFWRSGWFLVPLMLAALAGVDLFFALNYRIYTLLEKEDWPALIQELENQVIRKGNYSPRLVKLLINTYLVLSDARSVTELEKKLSVTKKKLVNANALNFGAARVLHSDYQGAEEFFSSKLSGRGLPGGYKTAEWMRWYHGFSLLLARRFDEAADAFILLARDGREGILAGLSAYFLNNSLAGFLPRRSEELRKEAEMGKERVKSGLKKRNDWDRELKQAASEIYAAILKPYYGKTADYLYLEEKEA